MPEAGDDAPPLADTFVALAARAGVAVHVPPDAAGTCCGVPFSSKGYTEAHALAANRAIARFWRWSDGGRLPVFVDTSPCTYGLLHARDVLTDENRARFDALTILDGVAFVHDVLLPRLAVTRKEPSAVLHPVCSLVKMGLVPKLEGLARACAETVTIPQDAGCCGFAGDRGFLFPELTASATRLEAEGAREAAAAGHWSSSRTCEAGLSRATGARYRSFVYLVGARDASIIPAMRVALLQMDLAWEDWKSNHAGAAKLLKRAADDGASLALLPEMFATGFSMDGAKIAQPPGGPSEQWLRGMARGLGLHLVAGLAETCDASGAPSPLPCNNALWVTPDGEVARYTKLHPFSFAGEDAVYAKGSKVVTWTIEGLRVTPQVCYDLRFPEPFRLAAEQTDLFAVVANWPERRRHHWRLLLQARAVENLCYVAGVNRVGEDGKGNRHMGDSSVTSPWGETLVSAAETETVLIADVDAVQVAEARAKFPVLDDRRPSYVR